MRNLSRTMVSKKATLIQKEKIMKPTDHQVEVIKQLCNRMKRNDFKIDSDSLEMEELKVLEALDQANANTPCGGWWTDDDENIVVEYDYDHGIWDVYCGNGWI